MKIIANGFPKAGGHALKKGLELLGHPVIFNHYPFPSDIPRDAKHIIIFRNPRNCLISMVRWLGKPLTTGTIISTLRDYHNNQSMAKTLSQYIPWKQPSQMLDEGDSWLDVPLCVNYENLMMSDAALRHIATYLETPFYEDAFKNLPGLTATWSGKPSKWK